MASSDSIPAYLPSPLVDRVWRKYYSVQGASATEKTLQTRDSDSHSPTPHPKEKSALAVRLPLAADKFVRDLYKNPWGQVRVGRLLEDLDALAGSVIFSHSNEFQPQKISKITVTAAIHDIVKMGDFQINQDLVFRGKVDWVGRSSAVVTLDLFRDSGPAVQSWYAESDKSEYVEYYGRDALHVESKFKLTKCLQALATFVGLDPATGKSSAINPLLIESPEDQQRFDEIDALVKLRKSSLQLKWHSSVSFQDESFTTWLGKALASVSRYSLFPALRGTEAVVKSAETESGSLIVCMPEQRNVFGRVFGGFLMRHAYELAFATAYTFSTTHPRFVEIQDVVFRRPVNIGDILKLRCKVCYSGSTMIHAGICKPDNADHKFDVGVEVIAEVIKPEKQDSDITNTFSFVFSATNNDDPKGNPDVALPIVAPCSEEEGAKIWRMMMLRLRKSLS